MSCVSDFCYGLSFGPSQSDGFVTDPFPPGALGSGCLVHVLREGTPNSLNYHTFCPRHRHFIHIPGKHEMASNVDHQQAALL